MKSALATLATVSLLLSTGCSNNPLAPDRAAAAGTSVAAGTGGLLTSDVSVSSIPAQTSTFPMQWTLTRAQCPSLWTDWVTGTGTGHFMVRIVPSSEGVFQINAVDTVSGTAVDATGGRFRFAYTNAFLLVNLAGPAFQQTVTDSFNLVGPGGKALRVSVGYVSRFKLDSSGNLVLNELNSRGDVSCQPL